MGTQEVALLIAETNPFQFPLASEKRGPADNAGRPGSRRSNESSCCVSGKQQQEPWAQFTHTWHPARRKAVPLMPSRPAPRSAGRGPGPRGGAPDSKGGR